MLRLLAWLEIVASIGLFALTAWPFSGFCSGRFIGLDCESQAIFGVNMFGPMAILALISDRLVQAFAEERRRALGL